MISVYWATSKHKHQIIIGKTSSVSVPLLASSQKCLRANENGASRKFQRISATKVHFNVRLPMTYVSRDLLEHQHIISDLTDIDNSVLVLVCRANDFMFRNFLF